MAALNEGQNNTVTRSRFLNRLQYDVANIMDDITTAATGDKILMLDASDNYAPKYADGANVLEMMSNAGQLSKGAGVSAMETYASGVFVNGTIITTRIVIDLTGLVGSGTDVDIIGNTGGAASAHLGQITAALNGTIVGGRVTCLEVPTGGTADINFYSANESTGAQDALASALTETVLIDAAGSWTSGATKGMTALPPANDYLYVANGAASGGTFTAGKFLIELYGV